MAEYDDILVAKVARALEPYTGNTGPAIRAALATAALDAVASDLEARVHARWHRALDDPNIEPTGPIRDHIAQHDAAVVTGWLSARTDRIGGGR